MIVQELFAKLGLKVDTEAWEKGEGAIGKLKGALAGVAAALSVRSVWHMVSGVSELADAAVKSAQKLGITVEAVQELGYAAKLSDVSQGELESGLMRLQRGLDELSRTGKGPLAESFQRLGISMNMLKGETLDQNLELIAEKFKNLPDGPKKASIAFDIFGRSMGARMIPLLNSGQEGIVELRNEAHELGIVVSEDAAKQFEEFNDQQTKLSETWRGLKTQVVTALFPAIQGMVTGLEEWLKKNRELIASGLEIAVKGMVFVVELLAKAFEYLMTVVQFLADNQDILIAVLIGIAVAARAAAVSLIQAGIAVVIAWAPVIAVIAAVAALVLGVKLLIDHWDQVKEALLTAWESVKEFFAALPRYIGLIISRVLLWWYYLGKVIVENWDSIKSAVGRTLSFLWSLTQRFFEFIWSVPGRLIDAWVGLAQAIVETLGNAFDWVIDQVKGVARTVWNELKDIPVLGDILGAGESAASAIADWWNSDSSTPLTTGTQETISTTQTGNLNATFGDVQVTVTPSPGMDENALAQAAAKAAIEHQQKMITDAHDAMKGGKR